MNGRRSVDRRQAGPFRGFEVRIPQNLVQEANACDAIGHGVMDSDGDCFAAVGKRPDHIECPQRSSAVEVLGHQFADRFPQVGPRNAVRCRAPADVVADVEFAGLDPPRLGPRGVDALGRARLRREPLRHCRLEGIDVVGPRRLEDDELQGVAGDDGRFDLENVGVVASRSGSSSPGIAPV